MIIRCFRNRLRAASVLLCCTLMSGCIALTDPLIPEPGAPLSRPAPQASMPANVGQADPDAAYRLSIGDQIDVKFFYNPELNEALIVRPDGGISLQLVGELRAAGVTPQTLEKVIDAAYAKVLRRPQSTVIVRRFAPQRVFVGGEVGQQAALPLDGPITALQAVVQAGGFRFNAERSNVLVFRTDPVARTTDILVLDLGHAQPPGSPARRDACAARTGAAGCQPQDFQKLGDIQLRANDVLYVPQSRIGRLAQFMDENIGRILPLYKNLGFSFFYNVREQPTTVTVPAQ